MREVSRALAALIVGLLSLSLLTACDKGTIGKNTNPTGNPNVLCVLGWTTSSGDYHEKEFAPANCKRCQLGAEFPKCMDERDVQTRRETVTPDREGGVSPDPVVLRVVASSTNRGFSITIVIVDASGRERRPDVFNESTRERELTFTALEDDRSIRVTVIATLADSAVSCEILGPGRAPWAGPNVKTGKVSCFSAIAERV